MVLARSRRLQIRIGPEVRFRDYLSEIRRGVKG